MTIKVRYIYRSGEQSNLHRKRDADEKTRDDTRPAESFAPLEATPGNETDTELVHHLMKRDFKTEVTSNWALSQISFPKFLPWDQRMELEDGDEHNPANGKYAYFYDDTMGQGQKLYMIEAGWLPNAEVS